MILREQNYCPESISGQYKIPMIPATFDLDNNILEFKNNGTSEVFFGQRPSAHITYRPESFKLYGFGNDPKQRPFFIRQFGGTEDSEMSDEGIRDASNAECEMWELFYVYSKRIKEPDGTVKKRHVLYTCLRECKQGTLYCVCETCGKHFVITPQAIKFYKDRGLKIPSIRCPECIQAKKIKYNK